MAPTTRTAETPAAPTAKVRAALPTGSTPRPSLGRMNRVLRTHSGLTELAIAIALYGVYEVVRGFGSTTLAAARAHTDHIVAIERDLGLFVERGIQQAVDALPGVPT